ncbi:MAG: 23S rRNA (uracil(1939)-C(5))-methyltransferase RlmD [Gammaproteobacteria bacterium]|nr:23S rRNA (uracil(1939)-C(5))-methyltransferase RlmD [Gammaproteobacteria bacterium]
MSRRRRNRRKFSTEPVQVEVESLTHEGKGVAHVDGKVVFIDGALPGESIMMRLYNRKRNYDEGSAIEVLRASPERIDPRCPHYDICGGCSLQHMSHEAQIRAKQAVLVEQFEHIGRLEIPDILPPLTAEIWGYRRKARLGVRYVAKKGKVLVGFRERHSSFIADMQGCEVLHPSVGKILPELSDLVASLSQFERIPQIEVAAADNVTALVFRHLDDLSSADCEKLADFGRQHDLHIYLQPKGPDTVHAIWPESSELVYRLHEYEVENAFRPTDFTQVNHDINHQMVHRAVEMLAPGPDERVLDLFCGLGNFTLPLSRRAGEVVGVEGDAALIERARANAERNGADNVAYHVSDLTEDMLQASWASAGFDKVLLDPPRSGALEVLPLVAKLGARRIVYVSCNPATLARDAGELVNELGYELKSAGIMDMFPHTGHVESIALFEKK